MGHFYNPPPPSQGNSAGTPPLPHDPIPAQGASPAPIRQAALAVTMLAVLASWPADLEPRLQRPNDVQQKIAPLTLVYGQQPPRRAALSVQQQTIVASWPLDLEPRLGRPNDLQQKIAPLTLRYGQEQRNPPLSAQELAKLVSLWPTEVGPTLPWPYWTRNVSAPAIPVPPVAFVPFVRPPYALIALASETYDVSVVWRGVQAPDNPNQPPCQFPLSIAQQTIVGAWPADLEPRLQRPNESQRKSVFLPPPVVSVVAYTPPPYAILAAHQPPPVAMPTPVAIAPLTLPTGSSPTPQGPLSVSELAQLVASWPQGGEAQSGPKLVQPATGATPTPRGPLPVTALTQTIAAWATTWDAQTAPESAAWNVPPILSAVPYSTLPRAIWTAWEPPFIAPPTPVTIAPLTLAYGSQPPPRALQSNARLVDIAASWIQSWDAQTAPESAGWNVPPILVSLPYTPPPRLIWTAWEPPWVQPPAPVAVAVLTLPTGNPPPPRGLDRQVATAALWVGDPALPSRPLAAGWNVPAIGYVPPSVFPLAIRAAWDQVAIAVPRLVTIATAAIPPPQAPPPRSGWTPAHAIAHAAWPSALEPAKALQSIVIWLTPSGPATSLLRFVTVTNERIQTASGGAETIATAAGGVETIATVHTAQEAIDA